MSTTSAYGWNIPDNTDLVKDGALAIRTLGNAIDTSMNTALGTKKAGMVLLNTTSFSAVSSQSLPANVFTSAYSNYHLVARYTPSTTLEVRFRWRAAGVDDTTSNYSYQYVRGIAAATPTASFNTTTFGFLSNATFSVVSTASADIFNVQAATPTIMTLTDMELTTIGTTQHIHNSYQYHNVSTSYDSLTLIASTGNITGSISVYGYNV